MKPNDQAYQAALRATSDSCSAYQIQNALDAAYAAQFPPSEDHKPLKKAWLCYRLCEGGGAYDGPFFIKYDPYEENDYDKIEPILYYDAAQFQSEDYAVLVKELRDGIIEHRRRFAGDTHDDLGGTADYEKTHAMTNRAADALEAVLAERDDFAEQLALRSESGMAKDMQEIMRINNKLVAERDAAVAEIDAISSAIKSHRYMDPPDGGNVSIAEQIKRLWEETEARGRRIAELEAALKDARETALEEAAIEIERIGHSNYPAKLITDGHAFAVRSLKAGTALEKSDDN